MNTLFTGRKIIELDLTGSTNSYALELLKDTLLPEGTWILARHQKEGRGQMGNTWESEPGKNITGSLVLYPVFLPLAKQFLLSKAVSLGLYDLLRENLSTSHSINIKWPNDIYVNGKKIAGILIENSVRQGDLHFSVVGIGLNVNQENFSAALGNAISMSRLSGKEFDLRRLLEQLSAHLEARYLQLRAGKDDSVSADYLEKLLNYKRKAEYSIGGKQLTGTIVRVEDNGKLVMELESGKIVELDTKEVVFLHTI